MRRFLDQRLEYYITRAITAEMGNMGYAYYMFKYIVTEMGKNCYRYYASNCSYEFLLENLSKKSRATKFKFVVMDGDTELVSQVFKCEDLDIAEIANTAMEIQRLIKNTVYVSSINTCSNKVDAVVDFLTRATLCNIRDSFVSKKQDKVVIYTNNAENLYICEEAYGMFSLIDIETEGCVLKSNEPMSFCTQVMNYLFNRLYLDEDRQMEVLKGIALSIVSSISNGDSIILYENPKGHAIEFGEFAKLSIVDGQIVYSDLATAYLQRNSNIPWVTTFGSMDNINYFIETVVLEYVENKSVLQFALSAKRNEVKDGVDIKLFGKPYSELKKSLTSKAGKTKLGRLEVAHNYVDKMADKELKSMGSTGNVIVEDEPVKTHYIDLSRNDRFVAKDMPEFKDKYWDNILVELNKMNSGDVLSIDISKKEMEVVFSNFQFKLQIKQITNAQFSVAGISLTTRTLDRDFDDTSSLMFEIRGIMNEIEYCGDSNEKELIERIENDIETVGETVDTSIKDAVVNGDIKSFKFSEPELIGLSKNGEIKGYRIKTEMGYFDIRSEVFNEICNKKVKFNRVIKVNNVGEMLASKNEIEGGTYVGDISGNKELCKRVLLRFMN